jgi:hypothetical protein
MAVVALAASRGIGRPEPSIGELLLRVEDERVDFINMQFTDVMGIVKRCRSRSWKRR